VIGKRGATAQSLRTLLRALGTKNEARYNLKIVDVDRPESERGVSAGTAAATVSSDDDADDATASVRNDDYSDDADDTKDVAKESDAVARTRKELQDLDDLDI
jgi:hypothetical protein